MSRSNKVKSVISTTILAAAAGLALAGCGEEDRDVYCVDGDNNVVDEDLCDDAGNVHGGGSYFFFVGNLGGNSYSPGQRIPQSYVSQGQRVSPGDSKARANAGLPKAGKVSSGTRISGGIGTGKPGGSAKGGSGGG